jgi:hypothetical protein
MDIDLLTGEQDQSLRFESIAMTGEGWFECRVLVQSHGLAAEVPFVFDQANVEAFSQHLKAMSGEGAGLAVLGYADRSGTLTFSFDPDGDLLVTGDLHVSPDDALRFRFIADGECVDAFARQFAAFLP